MNELFTGNLIEIINRQVYIEPRVAVEEVIVAGHSFGGATAITLSSQDSRVKACITLDPWMYPIRKRVIKEEIKLSCPFLAMSSETYTYAENRVNDQFKTLKKVFDYCQHPESTRDILVFGTGHLSQCDVGIADPALMNLVEGVHWNRKVHSLNNLFLSLTSQFLFDQHLIEGSLG